jgi:hypothetical protein
MDEIRIPYSPNKVLFLLAVLFFGGCSALFAQLAVTNDKGLILNGIIRFSPQGAAVFYWVMFGLSTVFVGIGVAALISSFIAKREIIITSTSICSPKGGFAKTNTLVNFRDIIGFDIQTIQKTRLLNIYYANGKLTIPASMVPGKEHFETLVWLMQQRCQKQ